MDQGLVDCNSLQILDETRSPTYVNTTNLISGDSLIYINMDHPNAEMNQQKQNEHFQNTAKQFEPSENTELPRNTNKQFPQINQGPLSAVESLLQSWGLYHSLGNIFKEHLIDIESLIDIKESDIDQLIPLFGIKIRFKKLLAEWRIANGHSSIPVAETLSMTSNVSQWIRDQVSETVFSRSMTPDSVIPYSPTADDRSSPITSLIPSTENLTNLNLREILKTDFLSNAALTFQEKFKTINEHHRKNVIAAITNYFLQRKFRLSTEDFNLLTAKILEIFPSEDKTSYYIERTESSQPRGTLYNKYVNGMRKLREQGLLKRYNTDYKKRRISDTVPGDHSYTDDDKLWLSFKHEPWPVVEELWKKTREQRRAEIISSADKTITQILTDWPRYKDRDGQRLIEIDFEGLHQEKSTKLLADFELYATKIIHYAKEKCKSDLPQEYSINNDVRIINIFKLIHHLLPPNTRSKLKVAEKVVNWKPTIQDSLNSMFICGNRS